jgi:hypothetical protein
MRSVMMLTDVGFQRYRRLWRGDIHAPYGENDIIEQEMMEEVCSSRNVSIGTATL